MKNFHLSDSNKFANHWAHFGFLTPPVLDPNFLDIIHVMVMNNFDVDKKKVTDIRLILAHWAQKYRIHTFYTLCSGKFLSPWFKQINKH